MYTCKFEMRRIFARIDARYASFPAPADAARTPDEVNMRLKPPGDISARWHAADEAPILRILLLHNATAYHAAHRILI